MLEISGLESPGYLDTVSLIVPIDIPIGSDSKVSPLNEKVGGTSSVEDADCSSTFDNVGVLSDFAQEHNVIKRASTAAIIDSFITILPKSVLFIYIIAAYLVIINGIIGHFR